MMSRGAREAGGLESSTNISVDVIVGIRKLEEGVCCH